MCDDIKEIKANISHGWLLELIGINNRIYMAMNNRYFGYNEVAPLLNALTSTIKEVDKMEAKNAGKEPMRSAM